MTTDRFQYYVYGLLIESDQPVPGLQPLRVQSQTEPEVRIMMGTAPADMPCESRLWTSQTRFQSKRLGDTGDTPSLILWGSPDEKYLKLVYRSGVIFIVQLDASRVWTLWPDTLSAEHAAPYLLGPILAFILRLRGVLCLHGSAVRLGQHALLLVGPAGMGKSTLAASFQRLGHQVLTDDVAPIVIQGGYWMLSPGYSKLRLWPDAASALYGEIDHLPPIAPSWEKRYLNVDAPGSQAIPVGVICILSRHIKAGNKLHFERATQRGAFEDLIANTYLGYLLDKTMQASDFRQITQIANTVPIYRGDVPDNPEYAHEFCEALLGVIEPVISLVSGHEDNS